MPDTKKTTKPAKTDKKKTVEQSARDALAKFMERAKTDGERIALAARGMRA